MNSKGSVLKSMLFRSSICYVIENMRR